MKNLLVATVSTAVAAIRAALIWTVALVVAADAQTMSFLREFTAPGIQSFYTVAANDSGVYVAGASVYVEGTSQDRTAGVRKFDSRGNELWTRDIRPLTAFGVVPLRVFADATGLYVVIAAMGSDARVLRKYSNDGEELWTRALSRFPAAVAVDTTGVYIAEQATLTKFNADGEEEWSSRSDDMKSPLEVTADSTGIYVFGYSEYAPTVPVLMVRKTDLRGNHVWTRPLPRFYQATFAAANRGFYVAVLQANGAIELYSFDSTGMQLWNRRVGSWSDAGPFGGSYAVADSSAVYIAGSLVQNLPPLPGQCRSGSGGDSFIRKYSASGEELWTRQFGSPDGSIVFGLAVNDSGVYVAGQSGAAPFWDDAGVPANFAPENRTSRAYLAAFQKASSAPAAGPRLFPGCVVNAGSYVGGGVAPGEIVSLFGAGIGPPEPFQSQLTQDGRLPTSVGETRVLFSGVPAPILYVSEKQINAIVPYSTADRTAVDVQVEYRGTRSAPETVPMLASRPGIFTLDGSGRGQAAVLNEDGTVNSPSNPARRGSVISIFATGGGEADMSVVNGQIVSGTVPRTSLPVDVLFDAWNTLSLPAEVLYAGSSPGSVAGLLQINVRVPFDVRVFEPRPIPLLLSIGTQWTPLSATVAVR